MHVKLIEELGLVLFEAMQSSGPIRFTLRKAGRIHGINRSDIQSISQNVFDNIIEEAKKVEKKYGGDSKFARSKGLFKKRRVVILSKQSKWYEFSAPKLSKMASFYKEIVINDRNTGKKIYFFIEVKYDDRFDKELKKVKSDEREIEYIQKQKDDVIVNVNGFSGGYKGDYVVGLNIGFISAGKLVNAVKELKAKLPVLLKHEIGHVIEDYLGSSGDEEVKKYAGKSGSKKFIHPGKGSEKYKEYVNSRRELDAVIYEVYDDVIDYVKKNAKKYKNLDRVGAKRFKNTIFGIILFNLEYSSIGKRHYYYTEKSRSFIVKKIREGLVDAGVLKK